MNNTVTPKMITGKTFLWQTRTCAINGYLEKLTKYLTDPQCQHLVTQDLLDKCLFAASETGQLSVIKYLLHSKDLLFNADLTYHSHEALRTLCTKKHTQCIEYLLTAPEVSTYAKINEIKNSILEIVFDGENITLLDKLLTSPELKNKFAHLHSHDDYVFLHALGNKNLGFIKNLIFEYDLQKTQKIIEHLYDYTVLNEDNSIVEKINDLFTKRELYLKLNNENKNFNQIPNAKKIKI